MIASVLRRSRAKNGIKVKMMKLKLKMDDIVWNEIKNIDGDKHNLIEGGDMISEGNSTIKERYICNACHTPIDEIDSREVRLHYKTYYPNRNDEYIDDDESDSCEVDGYEDEYLCPNCGVVLTRDYEVARYILLGYDINYWRTGLISENPDNESDDSEEEDECADDVCDGEDDGEKLDELGE